MKHLLALALAAFAISAQAANYTVTTDAPISESVSYGFNDTVNFTPTVSGVYNIDVIPQTVFGGCSTRYCHSKWSIQTEIDSATIGGVSLLPNSNISMQMVAGQTYTLYLSGIGKGTGVYAGRGGYTVGVVQQ